MCNIFGRYIIYSYICNVIKNKDIMKKKNNDFTIPAYIIVYLTAFAVAVLTSL